VVVEVRRAGAAELHAAVEPFDPDRITVRWCVPDAAAVVLGSRQPIDLLDPDRCSAVGLGIVRRNSGGGAVLVDPESAIWIDLLVPLPDPVVPDDLSASMVVVGRWWSAALRSVLVAAGGPVDDLVVHEGRLMTAGWGDLICFAGLGPGEVTRRGAKLVGLSQRRTRGLARFQTQIHLADPTDRLVGVLTDRAEGPVPRPALLDDPPLASGDVDAIALTLLDALARSVAAAPIA
jgi:lipoate-protein ligase A